MRDQYYNFPTLPTCLSEFLPLEKPSYLPFRWYQFQICVVGTFLGLATPILADFWIFSDQYFNQAQLLGTESAASKEPRSGLVAWIEVDGGSGQDQTQIGKMATPERNKPKSYFRISIFKGGGDAFLEF